ncbi:MAG: hypothetical protein IPK11_16875 [Ignavibacteria bacterium]|nr:hypothetical protein [Ignavibacteria bacterium]
MEGIILLADDELNSLEFMQGIYKGLIKHNKYPVLGLDNLDLTKSSILAINNIKALIIDYTFKEKSNDPDLPHFERRASELLEDDNLHIFSLIYVYSQENLEDTEFGKKLKKKYGENTVKFRIKASDRKKIDSEYEGILADIQKWDEEHSHLSVPNIWNKTLGQAIQNIFRSLNNADPNWIKDLYYSSFLFDKKGEPINPPPIDPNVQVINLFQNILSEHLIQNKELRDKIEEYSQANFKNTTDSKKLTKLYQYLYYTRTLDTDAIMTGDVYDLENDKYGIIIYPECDMNTLVSKDKNVELLCFEKDNFKKIDDLLNIKKDNENREATINRAYNQEPPRIHLLPNFVTSDSKVITALIDFRFCLELYKGSYLKDRIKSRRYKVNSPYIQQLRQRYLAYTGRVGVPAIPQSIRYSI